MQGTSTEKIPYLIIRCDEKEPYKIRMHGDFKLENKGGYLALPVSEGNEGGEIDVEDIRYLGIAYVDEEAGVDFVSDDGDEKLYLYDTEGRLIGITGSRSPDLRGLHPGNVYILKAGNRAIKYIPYK